MPQPLIEQPAGFLAIDKAAGWTSHDVVAKVRRLTGVRRVGHAGTLDPFATGLLIVAIGKATRLIRFAQDTAKTYLTTLRLGLETDTLDPEGRVAASRNVETWPSSETISAAIGRYVGTIRQTPPAHSAVHIDGKRAYEFARAGESVDIPAREVTIHSIALSCYAPPLIDLAIGCSTGTYVRSLARDIGRDLDTYAYCHSLRRTRSGLFDLSQALTIEELEKQLRLEKWSDVALPADIAVRSFPRIDLTAEQTERWYHGQSLSGLPGTVAAIADSPVRVYGAGGSFAGVGQVDQKRTMRPMLVYVLDG